MAVIEQKFVETEGGIRKNIDKDSMPLALDILQRGLYAFPIQSTVRELTSNAYDAVKERDVALSIISGASPVEDHFDVTKQDGIYHSSGWDPSYFDPNWLSTDPYVHIYYDEGSTKDLLRIVDNGVGLGKQRLVGYFQLNYSSKRANKDALGKWGLGSKVALSMNVDNFRVINRYNGQKSKFDVYLDKVDPITPKVSDGKMNGSLQLTDTCKAYYEETTEKNGLEVQVEIKKHNKKLLFEAIQSQLMYLPNVKVYLKEQGSLSYKEISIAARELYRDKNIIIAESTVFDKPHILLGTGNALINYGFIAFNELEIEPKKGAVGFILDVNDVEVTPSREALVWSPKTRKAVLEAYDRVSQTAAQFVNDSLSQETDYIEWMVKAAQTMSALRNGNNSSVIGRLASIIDASAITNVKYPKDKTIEYSSKVTEMIGSKLTARRIMWDRYSKKVERSPIGGVDAFALPTYFTDGKADPYVDRYLSDTIGTFVLIQPKETELYKGDHFATLVLSSAKIQKYSDVVIPDDIMEAYLSGEMEEDTTTDTSVATVDRSALRKANAQIVVHKINKSYNNYVFSAYDTSIGDIPSLYDPNEVAVYGTSVDRPVMKDLANMFPHGYLVAYDDWRDSNQKVDDNNVPFYTCLNKDAKPINMIVIAKENEKYFASSPKYKSVKQFVMKDFDKHGKLTFTDDIKAAATAAVIQRLIDEAGFSNILRSPQLLNVFPKHWPAYDRLHKGWLMSSYGPKSDARHLEFIKECISTHLEDAGITSGGELTTLLEATNKAVPDYLCDDIDEITKVDILLVDEIRFWIDFIGRIKRYKGLLDLYSSKYFYDKDQCDEVGKQVKELLDKVFDDEVV